jgi:hypothetical protein
MKQYACGPTMGLSKSGSEDVENALKSSTYSNITFLENKNTAVINIKVFQDDIDLKLLRP